MLFFWERGDECRSMIFCPIVENGILFYYRGVRRSTIRRIAIQSQVVLRSRILRFHSFRLSLIVPFTRSNSIVFQIFLSFRRVTSVQRSNFLFMQRVFICLFNVFIRGTTSRRNRVFQTTRSHLYRFITSVKGARIRRVIIYVVRVDSGQESKSVFVSLHYQSYLHFHRGISSDRRYVYISLVLPTCFPSIFLSRPRISARTTRRGSRQVVLTCRIARLTYFPMFSILRISRVFCRLCDELLWMYVLEYVHQCSDCTFHFSRPTQAACKDVCSRIRGQQVPTFSVLLSRSVVNQITRMSSYLRSILRSTSHLL